MARVEVVCRCMWTWRQVSSPGSDVETNLITVLFWGLQILER